MAADPEITKLASKMGWQLASILVPAILGLGLIEIIIILIRGKFKHTKRWQNSANAQICPKCGGKMVLRNGKYGEFYGCSNYPKCNHTATKK